MQCRTRRLLLRGRDVGFALVALYVASMLSAQTALAQSPAAANPNQQSMGSAVTAVCPQLAAESSRNPNDAGRIALSAVQEALYDRCRHVLRAASGTASVNTALQALTSEELNAAQTGAVDFVTAQTSNLASRLLTLRQGGIGPTTASLGFFGGGAYGSRGLYAGGMHAAAGGAEKGLFDNRLAFYAGNGFGSGTKDLTSLEAGHDADTKGFNIAADYRFTDAFVAGISASYGESDLDFDAGGKLRTDGPAGALYASWYGDRFYLDVIGSFSSLDVDSSRRIAYAVSGTEPAGFLGGGAYSDALDRIAQGRTESKVTSAGIGFGYNFGQGRWRIGPTIAVNYLDVEVDGFTETGAAELNLQHSDQSNESLQLQGGIEVGFTASRAWGILSPQARVVFVSEQSNDQRVFPLRYAVDPCSSAPGVSSGACAALASNGAATSFSVTSDRPDKSFVRWGVTLSLVRARGWGGFIDYESVAGLDTIDYGEVTVGFRYEFQ
jgi:Autotransporter beta-domain